MFNIAKWYIKVWEKIVGFASYGVIGDFERTVLEGESRVKSRFWGTEGQVGVMEAMMAGYFLKMFSKEEKKKQDSSRGPVVKSRERSL